MAVWGASRALHLRLELNSRALFLFPWARRRGHVLHRAADAPTGQLCRRLVSCRQGGSENVPEENEAKKGAFSKHDEQLRYYRDADDAALELVKNSCVDELERLSFEEESCNGESRIHESIARDVENTAIELLAGRAFTVSELRKKLRGKKYPIDIVDAVVADFKDRGMLNDDLYAESFSRSRWLSSSWGPRRIKQALLQKGVSEVQAEKATKRTFEDDDDEHADSGDTTQFGMSESSLQHLLCQAAKQWRRGQGLPTEKRRARIARWLQYRGFNWAVTSAVLKRLEAQYPP